MKVFLEIWLKINAIILLWLWLEYVDCIPYREIWPPRTKKGNVRGITLNCIWWWAAASGSFGNVEYLLYWYYSQVQSDSDSSTWYAPIYGSHRSVWKSLVLFWFLFLCLMALRPSWVIQFQSHSCRRILMLLFNSFQRTTKWVISLASNWKLDQE